MTSFWVLKIETCFFDASKLMTSKSSPNWFSASIVFDSILLRELSLTYMLCPPLGMVMTTWYSFWGRREIMRGFTEAAEATRGDVRDGTRLSEDNSTELTMWLFITTLDEVSFFVWELPIFPGCCFAFCISDSPCLSVCFFCINLFSCVCKCIWCSLSLPARNRRANASFAQPGYSLNDVCVLKM